MCLQVCISLVYMIRVWDSYAHEVTAMRAFDGELLSVASWQVRHSRVGGNDGPGLAWICRIGMMLCIVFTL